VFPLTRYSMVLGHRRKSSLCPLLSSSACFTQLCNWASISVTFCRTSSFTASTDSNLSPFSFPHCQRIATILELCDAAAISFSYDTTSGYAVQCVRPTRKVADRFPTESICYIDAGQRNINSPRESFSHHHIWVSKVRTRQLEIKRILHHGQSPATGSVDPTESQVNL
jgi:hypothetical protein